MRVKRWKAWKVKEAQYNAKLDLNMDELKAKKFQYEQAYPDSVPWYAEAEDVPEQRADALIRSEAEVVPSVSPMPSEEESPALESTPIKGEVPNFQLWWLRNPQYKEEDIAFAEYKRQYPDSIMELSEEETPISELAEQVLDEFEIPNADPFRSWFIARSNNYYLPSSGEFALDMAEAQFEEEQDRSRIDTPKEVQSLEQLSERALLAEEVERLKAEKASLLIQQETMKQVKEIEKAPIEAQPDLYKDLLGQFMSFMQKGLNVQSQGAGAYSQAEQLQGLGVAGTALLGSLGGKALGKAGGSLVSGVLGGGSSEGGGSTIDKLIQVLILQMLGGQNQGYKRSSYGRTNYSNSGYSKKKYSGYRSYRRY